MNYTFTESAKLQAILQDKIQAYTFEDLLFDLMPIDYIDAAMVVWEQKDNYTGVTQPRAYDGGFGRVQREAWNQYRVQPGVYGDEKPMLEEYLTVGREIGQWGTAIDIRKAQVEDQEHLLGRAIDRIRLIGWTLLGSGTYSVPGPNGTVLATDTFPLQTFVATYSWSNESNSTPLQDIRSMKILARGHSVRFDSTAKFVINQTQANYMFANQNPADLGGRRKIDANGNIETLNLKQINEIMLGENLPQIVIYDEGFYPDPTVVNGVLTPSAFQLFIPTGTGILVGSRTTGEALMKFWMTRNANNMATGRGSTEIYTDFEFKKNPVQGITSLAFNGAPAIYFPTGVVQASI